MFSYLNGIRPGTRRAASSQVSSQHQLDINGDKYEGSAHGAQRYLSSSSGGYTAFGGLNSRPATADPPSLPPIPRIASQYGASYDASLLNETSGVQMREPGQSYEHVSSSRDSDIQSNTDRTDQLVTSRPRGPFNFAEKLATTSQSTQNPCIEAASDGHRGLRIEDARSYKEPNSNKSTSKLIKDEVEYRNQSSQQSMFPTRSQSQHPLNVGAIQPRHGRPKLNLLNPMSILSRRRSSQTIVQINENSYTATKHTSSSGSRLPDDYDPRIRGKVVHDFSAPRSGPYIHPRDKNMVERLPNPYTRSEDKLPSDRAQESDAQPVPPSQSTYQLSTGDNTLNSERQHTPIFKEQFEEAMESWRFDVEDRRNQHTTGLLDRMTDEEPHNRHSPLPPFARNFPSDVGKDLHMQDTSFLAPRKTPPLTGHETDPPDSGQSRVVAKVFSTTTPPKNRSRATSITDPSFQGAGLPKHLKSNSSRFSFDLAGVGSAAQEKLLEEKHRQKNTGRKHGSMASRISVATSSANTLDGEDEFIGDDTEYDDGLEEKIPGVNADADDETVYEFDHFKQATNFSRPQDPYRQSKEGNGSDEGLTGHSNPLVAAPMALGISNTSISLALNQQSQESYVPVSNENALSNFRVSQNSTQHFDGRSLGPQKRLYEDDLYFDDGVIDHFDDWDNTTFDESIFDDDTSRIYGLPLRDLKPLPNIIESSSAETSQQSTRPISAESGSRIYHTHPEMVSEMTSNSMPPPNIIPVRRTSHINKASSVSNFDQPAGLTYDNLAAYHSALALAADRAARDGRFERKHSIDTGEKEQDLEGVPNVHVSFNENHIGQARRPPEFSSHKCNADSFDFDDEQDDDAIIAAANAEALENDDEGFYGREFGFFAHSNGSGEAQYANGGYFGPAGLDGLKRSHSGKADFQEPSLTPITERSEWSQRNSMVSLAMQSLYPPSLPTPGLAQLADAMQYEDDNMSLSALLKLRRGAFGGSNGSLVSSGSHKSASQPQSYLPPTSGAVLSSALSGSHLAGSSYSLVSNSDIGSETDVRPESPTLTLQTQGLTMAPPGTLQDRSSGSDSSPKRRNAVKGHSRSSSGTESISYVKELDEDGAGRWVLEKRRTAEGGQIEILGRQVVEGGRI